MKGFTRTETRFSLCGLNCALCSMHLGGYCPGCGGGAGNQSCAMAPIVPNGHKKHKAKRNMTDSCRVPMV